MEAVDFEGCSLSTCFGDCLGTDVFLTALTNRIHKQDKLDLKFDGDNGIGVGV